MNDNVLNIIITNKLSMMLFKYIFLHSSKKAVFISVNSKLVMVATVQTVLFFLACMYKGKFCSEMIKSFVQIKDSLYIFVDVIQVKAFFFLLKCQQLIRVHHLHCNM